MIDPLINEKAALAVSLLLKNKKKVACAESCTGGLLSAAITEISGSSSVFDFGAVTYANTMKQRLLGVSAETLAVYGAVSEQTARAMAKGILSYSGADYALSITGIAGPQSDGTDKPVGLVYICLASAAGQTVVRRLDNQFTENIRENNRKAAVLAALELLIAQFIELG